MQANVAHLSLLLVGNIHGGLSIWRVSECRTLELPFDMVFCSISYCRVHPPMRLKQNIARRARTPSHHLCAIRCSFSHLQIILLLLLHHLGVRFCLYPLVISFHSFDFCDIASPASHGKSEFSLWTAFYATCNFPFSSGPAAITPQLKHASRQ